jgi:hypothetical protein
MQRFIIAMVLASTFAGCASAGQTSTVCPDIVAAVNVILISPAPGATGVADNLPGITVQGILSGATQGLVTLTPSGGGTALTIVDTLTPIPQPGPTQYNLPVPALAAHTTYSVTITLGLQFGTAACPGLSSEALGSFTTQ